MTDRDLMELANEFMEDYAPDGRCSMRIQISDFYFTKYGNNNYEIEHTLWAFIVDNY